MARWNLDEKTALEILSGLIEYEQISGTDLVAIRVRHTSAADAWDIAGTVVESYRSIRNQSEKRRAEEILVDQDQELQDPEDVISKDPVTVHEMPVIATKPVSPKIARNLAIGLVAGVVVGALVLCTDRSSGRIA